MTCRKTLALIALIAICLLPTSASARKCRDSGNADCFILRAKAADHAALAAQYDLEVLRQLDANDPDLVLVSGPSGVFSDATEAAVAADPMTVGFEPVVLAALTENADGALQNGEIAVLDTLGASGEYSGPEADAFATALWNGYFEQPALTAIQVAATHSRTEPEGLGEGSVVAVIDTGVDPRHPLLEGALVPGYDFILDQAGIPSEWNALEPPTASLLEQNLRAAADQSFTGIVEGDGATVFTNSGTGVIVDQSFTGIVEQSFTGIVEQSFTGIVEGAELPAAFGHGTMVAGIVRLVAPRAKIMPIRVFQGDGTADISDIIEAIRWAVDNGANVINMSFSTDAHSHELSRAIKHAKKNRVLTVSSAGNASEESLTYPAAYGDTFGVASVDDYGTLSAFSNYGSDLVLLAAPGEGIITAYPGKHMAAAWGTSFSAAFVSGTAALLHDLGMDFEVERIKVNKAESAFEDSTLQVDPENPVDELGAGLLDVHGAFENGLGAD